jgi:DNA-binding NtrC family response regulator
VLDITKKWCAENNIPKKEFLASPIEVLKQYSWPGNVRALQNSVKRALNQAKNCSRVEISHLDDVIRNLSKSDNEKVLVEDKGKIEIKYKMDKINMFVNTIKEHGGSATKAAKALGSPRSTFHDQLKALGIIIKELVQQPK